MSINSDTTYSASINMAVRPNLFCLINLFTSEGMCKNILWEVYFNMSNIAVIGAGNGGQAMAAFLALKGYRVNLYNRTASRIAAIKEEGGIHLSGLYKGYGKLNKVTTSIQDAIDDVELIMVVTPAIAHKYLAEEMEPYLVDGQKIVLNPGRTGGALEFNNILKEHGCRANVIISEAQTFIYASRVIGPAQARIFGMKKRVSISALPSNRTREVVDMLFEVFPQFLPVENVLKTSLDNIGAIFHPAPTLLNMAWIESTQGKFNYYQDGISPSISKIMRKIDQERIAIATAMGVEPISAKDWLRMSYGVRGKDLYDLLQNNMNYHGIKAPGNIKHRYIFEDVPMSLVPIASIGRKFNVETPTINLIIDLANIVFDTDFRKEGRTVETLGIAKLNNKQITNFVNTGNIDNVEYFPGYKSAIYDKLDNLIFTDFNEYQKEVE